MFASVVELADLTVLSDADLLATSVTIERSRRGLEAQQVMVLTEIDRRGLHLADGHRGIDGWGRAVHRWTYAEARARLELVRLGRAAPVVLDRLASGTLGVAQAHLLAKAYSHPRCGPLLIGFLPLLLKQAATLSMADFDKAIRHWKELADEDGPDPSRNNAERRRGATLAQHKNGFSFCVTGGVIDGVEFAAVLRRYEQTEWDLDWAWTTAQHGDDAVPAQMPRTPTQRRYDAFMKLARDSASTPPGSTPPEPLVNLMIDLDTFEQAVAHLFDDDTDDDGAAGGAAHPRPTGPAGPADPRRWCSQTTDGVFVPPIDILLAALRGQVRRVVTDRRGVVLDMGRRSRLFTGARRDAVLLAATRCTHPGCLVAASHSQADHLTPYSHGGHTTVSNGAPGCGHHNRWRYTSGARVILDDHGFWRTYRADGSEVAPPDSPDSPDSPDPP